MKDFFIFVHFIKIENNFDAIKIEKFIAFSQRSTSIKGYGLRSALNFLR